MSYSPRMNQRMYCCSGFPMNLTGWKSYWNWKSFPPLLQPLPPAPFSGLPLPPFFLPLLLLLPAQSLPEAPDQDFLLLPVSQPVSDLIVLSGFRKMSASLPDLQDLLPGSFSGFQSFLLFLHIPEAFLCRNYVRFQYSLPDSESLQCCLM